MGYGRTAREFKNNFVSIRIAVGLFEHLKIDGMAQLPCFFSHFLLRSPVMILVDLLFFFCSQVISTDRRAVNSHALIFTKMMAELKWFSIGGNRVDRQIKHTFN